MSKSRLAILAMLVAGLAATTAGCKKKEDIKAELGEAKVLGVTEQERSWADAEVNKLWSDLDVAERVKAFGPKGEELNFYRDLVVLTRHGHRLAGYGSEPTTKPFGDKQVEAFADQPGSLFAGHYIANRLRAMGVEIVLTQQFSVAQSINTKCTLLVGGAEYGLADGFHVMQPNHLQGVVTPERDENREIEEGLTGETLYAGGGKLAEYDRSAKDRIVVLDYAAGDRWLPAFAMGAKAVIFVGSDDPAPLPHHHLNFPANLPRFYVTRELAEKLKLNSRTDSPIVTVMAECRWEARQCRNVIGVIRGSKPRFADKDGKEKDKDEAILLAAPLDSLSEVPMLSPGARGAANCAALLKLAEELQRNRPRRDIIVAFLDGDVCNHAGARAFYGSLYRARAKKPGPTTLDKRMLMLIGKEDGERKYISNIQAVLPEIEASVEQCRRGGGDSPGGKKIDTDTNKLKGYKDTIRYLEKEAKALAGNVKDDLYLVRSEKVHLGNLVSDLTKKKERLAKASAGSKARSKLGTDSVVAEIERTIAKDRERIAALLVEIAELEAIERPAWSKVQRALNREKYPDFADDEDIEQGINDYKNIVSEEGVSEDKKLLPKAERDEILRRFEQDKEEWKRRIKKGPIKYYQKLLDETNRVLKTRRKAIARLAEEAQQGRVLIEALGAKKTLIVLHLSVNLGDECPRWTFIHGNDSRDVHKSKDNPGTYAGGIFRVIRNMAAEAEAAGEMRLFESRTVEGIGAARRYASGLFAHSGSVAGMFGVPNLSLMTPLGRRIRDGQPCDVLRRRGPDGNEQAVLNVGNMITPLGEIAQAVGKLADAKKMSRAGGIDPQVNYSEFAFKNGRYSGGRVQQISGASPTADRPARGAFVAVLRKPGKVWEGARIDKTPVGFRPYCIVKSDINGNFEIPPLSANYYGAKLIVGAICDDHGLIRYISNAATSQTNQPLNKVNTVLFRCIGVTMVGFGYDRGAVGTQALRAESTAPLNAGKSLVAESRNVLSVYIREPAYKLKLFNKEGMVVLGNTFEDVEKMDPMVGIGLPIDPFQHWPVYDITPGDLGTLDKSRLFLLKKHDIDEPSLVKLHVEATEIRDQAKELPPQDIQRQMGRNAGAAAIFRSLYNPLLTVLNDLVLAVVLLLLLTIPFAYSIERLLVGTPHIYRQIGWFAMFFLVTFALLYVVKGQARRLTPPQPAAQQHRQDCTVPQALQRPLARCRQ